MNKILELIKTVIECEKGCPERVNHFLKVRSFAKIISNSENLDEDTSLTIDVAAILHDIGIKASLEKYNSSSGKHQEIEGPPIAEKILHDLGFQKDIIERVCFLIAHHHTYDDVDGIDYQILIEADFLVNIFEANLNKEAIFEIKDQYFKTDLGKNILDTLYLN